MRRRRLEALIAAALSLGIIGALPQRAIAYSINVVGSLLEAGARGNIGNGSVGPERATGPQLAVASAAASGFRPNTGRPAAAVAYATNLVSVFDGRLFRTRMRVFADDNSPGILAPGEFASAYGAGSVSLVFRKERPEEASNIRLALSGQQNIGGDFSYRVTNKTLGQVLFDSSVDPLGGASFDARVGDVILIEYYGSIKVSGRMTTRSMAATLRVYGSPIPEPGTHFLLGLGLSLLGAARRGFRSHGR